MDNGDSAPELSDHEDPANPGLALFPALGTLRNDMGAYGGLLGQTLPLFTSPLFSTQSDTLELGTLPGPGSVEKSLLFDKMGYGAVTIDSVRLGHVSTSELYCMIHLPMTLPVAPTTDSLAFSWNPTADGILLDTLRVYHRDTTTANPLLVIVTGKVSCCIGLRGNVDGWGGIDLGDLSYLIWYLTTPPNVPLSCNAAANVNGTGIIDLGDLSLLITYLTLPPGSISLLACP